jgi:TPR repeat protein
MARAEGMEGFGQVSPASSAETMFELGLLYCLGRGVEMDLVTAHKWFNIAAMRGCVAAKEYRTEICRDMTAKQIAEAQRSAREWIGQTAAVEPVLQ